MAQYLPHPVQHLEPSQIQCHCTREFCDSTVRRMSTHFSFYSWVFGKKFCVNTTLIQTNKSAPEDSLLHIPVPTSIYLTISSTIRTGPTVSHYCPQLKPKEVSWKLFFCPRYTQNTIITRQHFQRFQKDTNKFINWKYCNKSSTEKLILLPLPQVSVPKCSVPLSYNPVFSFIH